MGVFAIIEIEPIVQVGDKTRIKVDKTFVTQDLAAIANVEVDPVGDGALWISVINEMYLDWVYPTAGVVAPTCRVTLSDITPTVVTKTSSMKIISEAEDKLFANDSDLVTHEADILKWVAEGRATYKDIHRRVQTIIMQWLDKEGYVDVFNNRFTIAAIIDIEEVRPWATYMALRLIFAGLSNAIDDIFAQKANYYRTQEVEYRSKALLRIDVDGDGELNIGEGIDPAYIFVARR